MDFLIKIVNFYFNICGQNPWSVSSFLWKKCFKILLIENPEFCFNEFFGFCLIVRNIFSTRFLRTSCHIIFKDFMSSHFWEHIKPLDWSQHRKNKILKEQTCSYEIFRKLPEEKAWFFTRTYWLKIIVFLRIFS